MSEITRVVDGDTFKLKNEDMNSTSEGQSQRLGFTQVDESVHQDESKNTAKGKKASQFMKDVVGADDPEGIQNVETVRNTGVDHYGRSVGGAQKNIQGQPIDLALVQMDQGYSKYYNKFGVEKDPAMHDAYKEYYAKNSPYQHGEFRKNMSKKDYSYIQNAQKEFSDVHARFQDKDATREEMDQATYNLYKDPKMVAHFRYTNAGWNETLTPSTASSSDKDMIQFMLQDPELSKLYNKAVRNGHLGQTKRPERETSFWQNLEASASQFNSISNFKDTLDLSKARSHTKDYDLPKEQITKGVDPKYHSKLIEEADEYGGASALIMRDQMIEDVANNTIIDNLPWYSQIGYGIPVMLADPLAVIPAAGIAKGIAAFGKATSTFQGTRLWAQSQAFTNTSKAAAWTAAGITETTIQSLPRLTGDHTYTPRDLAMDAMVGGALGVVLGSVVTGVQYSNAKYKANQKLIREMDEHIENPDAPRYNSEVNYSHQETATNAGNSQATVHDWTAESNPVPSRVTTKFDEEVSEWKAGGPAPTVVDNTLPNAPLTGKSVSEMKFTPWAAISVVSTAGFQAAGRKIRNLFPKDSPMNILINRQIGHNDKAGLETVKSQTALTKELREAEIELETGKLDKSETKEMIVDIKRELLEVDAAVKLTHEINSEILHLASVYPDGKVPADVMKTIRGVMYTQKDVRQVNVMDQVLQGKTTDPTQLLGDYVETLKKLPEFEGNVPAPKKELDFIHEFEDIINMERKVDKDDLFTLTQGISKEVSWIKDMVEMNKLARKSKDTAFKEQVEQLNGIVAARLKQADDGDFGGHRAGTADIAAPSILKQRTKPFGKKKLTGTEIIAIMKKEGFTSERGVPTSAAYKKRFAELRKENVAVSREVQGVGDLNKTTSDVHTQGVREGETHYSLDDKQAELEKLEKTPDLDFEGRQALGKLRAELDPKSQQLTTGTKTETEVDAEDILPRDLNQIDSVNAYNTPTKANLEKLRNKLRSINKKNGSTKISGKKESLQQRKRLAAITKRVKANKAVTVQRMLDNGNMADLVDVIRVSHQVAEEAALAKRVLDEKKPAKQTETVQPESKTLSKAEYVENAQARVDTAQQKLVDANSLWEKLKQVANAVVYTKKRADAKVKALVKSNAPLAERAALLKRNDLWKAEQEALDVARTAAVKAQNDLNDANMLLDNVSKSTDDIDMSKPVTEAEVHIMYSVDVNKVLTPNEQIDIQTRIDVAVDKKVSSSAEKVSMGLAEWVRSGEKKRTELANKVTGATDFIGRAITRMTKTVGAIFIDSDLTSMKFFGSRVTEVSRGYGGNAKRAPTAGTITSATLMESIVKIIPQYRKMIDAYAESKGAGSLGRLKARERAGQVDPNVDKFNREVFLVQEYRRQGKPLPKDVHKSVTDFVDQWDYYMDHNHNTLVDAGVAGFTAARKVKHYIPHIWQTGKFRGAITKHGRAKVEAALSKAYMNLSTDANIVLKADADAQATKLIDDVLSDTYVNKDQYSPALDARSRARTDLDTTTELDGVRILDLLDTEVIQLGTKYSNRVAGWVGLSKATNGMINSQADIDVFKENMIAEAIEKGINPKKYVQMFEDTIDQLFGRPTKNMLVDGKGLTRELNDMKDLAATTKMGGLGTAQLSETGQTITRMVMNTFSDEKMAKKVLSMGRGSKSDSLLLDEIQSISNITDDMEFLDRQQTHLDTATTDEVSATRNLSLNIAHTATGGNLKAEASRGLGKLSGYNMIRRAQSRVVQASFMLDIANHFTKGKGVMGNARMADVGLTDTLGKNPAMEAAFKKYAEFDADGVLQKLNISKWDKAVREELQYAMIRDEAQQIQRTMVGELPPWMNKPIMGLIFQFRQMPIVANSKSLGRSLAFADKEAVTGVMLNTAIAGMVRYAKFAALGTVANALTGDVSKQVVVTEEQTQKTKYITPLGIFPDMEDLVVGRSGLSSIKDTESSWDFMQNQVPVAGLINDYFEAGKSAARGDIQGMVDSASQLVPLGNTALAEVVGQALMNQIGKLPSVPEDKTPKPTPKQKVKVQPSVAPTKKTAAPQPTAKPTKVKKYVGKAAVKEVTRLEGPLNAMQKRIVELEGYVAGDYKDDVGVSTSGTGQTGKYKDMTFKETVADFVKKAKSTFTNYDKLPKDVQTELVQLYYRGDVKKRFDWVKLVNQGELKKASVELLDHEEYRERKAVEDDGVTKRLEEASKILANSVK